MGITGTLSSQPTPYVTNTSYAPQGAPYKETYGNQLTRTWNYNMRLQPSSAWDAIYDNPSSFLWMDNPID